MSDKTIKIKKAWEDFEQKINLIKKKQADILTRMSEKLDRQHLEKIRYKINE